MRRANTTATRPTGTSSGCVTVVSAGQQSDWTIQSRNIKSGHKEN